jgi:hypothetical protein
MFGAQRNADIAYACHCFSTPIAYYATVFLFHASTKSFTSSSSTAVAD